MLLQAGNTALHLAAAGGHILVVRELLAAGADPYRQNQVRAANRARACPPVNQVRSCQHVKRVQARLPMNWVHRACRPINPVGRGANLCTVTWKCCEQVL